MAEDAGRDALFGGAKKRNANKPNPYADVPAGADASAPKPQAAPAPAAPKGGANSSANADDDPNRSLLLAGGKKKPAPAPVAAAPVEEAPVPMQASEMFEGDLDFHFEDLNLTGGAGQQDLDGGDVDFAAIDEDMARFQSDEVVREALGRGVDLRQYSKQVEGELHSLELRSIADYVAESDNIAALFEQICGCESVLTTMQSLLQGFQENLGGISDEIRSLQEESLGLSVRMQNRKTLNGKIKAFLARVAVSESLISRIVEGEVNEGWLRDLRALSEKVEFISGAYKMGSALPTRAEGLPLPALPADELGAGAYSDSLSELTVNPFETPAGRDAVPQVEKLRQKAVSRVREFLLRNISEVVRPQLKMNVQKQQEYVLLKYAYAQAFLTAHGPEAAKEVRLTYQDGVSRVYGEVFKTYAAELGRLALPTANKFDVIGNFDASSPGAFTGQGAAKAASDATTGAARPPSPFNVTDRLQLLTDADSPPIPLHVAQAEKSRMPFDAAFRSVQKHLQDVAGAEATFCHRFFGAKEGKEVYATGMAKAIAAVVEMVESHVGQCWDAPGLLLMLAITTAHRRSLADRAPQPNSRGKPANAAAQAGTAGPLDSYFDRVCMLLWPRFRSSFDANLMSIKGASSKKLGPADPGAPHAVTRRFADFSSGILAIHARMAELASGLGEKERGGLTVDEAMPQHLLGFVREMEAVWGRLASEMGAGGSGNALPGAAKGLPRAAFMLHQYACVLSAFSERGLEATSSPAAAHVSTGHARMTSSFVDETIDNHFKVLLTFVRKVETAAAADAKARGVPAPAIAGAVSSESGSGTAAAGADGATAGGAGGTVPSFLPEGQVNIPAEAAEAEAIVRDFSLNWRSGLSGLNEDVTRFFGRDVRMAMGVLKAAFSRFVEVHARLAAILARAFPSNPAWARELVPLQTIYFEMRRYGRNAE